MAFGDTFPTRYGMPASQVTAYTPDPTAWAQNWQSRYDNQIAHPTSSTNPAVQSLVDRHSMGADLTFPGFNFVSAYTDPNRDIDREAAMIHRQNAHALRDLTEEKNLMVPQLEAATRAEQGYQQQTGWGQTNGLMSANYTDPDFGQINGDFGQSKLGQSSLYAVQPTQPQGVAPNTIWGAAPQRVRQWGI